MRDKSAPRDDLDELYDTIQGMLRSREERYFHSGRHVTSICALTQLNLARELDYRDCLDHCTYIIAKNNCNSAAHIHACQPLSRKWSYIKIMLDAKVFSTIDRCQVPLIDQALDLNATAVEPQLYETIKTISRQLSFEKDRKQSLNDDMIVNSMKPFFMVRRLILWSKTNFIENILHVMRQVETLKHQERLGTAIDARSLHPRQARVHFQRLLLAPCREYINIMHKPMDASIFFGRTRDLGGPRFNRLILSNETKIKFFKLLHMYESCVFLDDANYFIDWKKPIVNLLFE